MAASFASAPSGVKDSPKVQIPPPLTPIGLGAIALESAASEVYF